MHLGLHGLCPGPSASLGHVASRAGCTVLPVRSMVGPDNGGLFVHLAAHLYSLSVLCLVPCFLGGRPWGGGLCSPSACNAAVITYLSRPLRAQHADMLRVLWPFRVVLSDVLVTAAASHHSHGTFLGWQGHVTSWFGLRQHLIEPGSELAESLTTSLCLPSAGFTSVSQHA